MQNYLKRSLMVSAFLKKMIFTRLRNIACSFQLFWLSLLRQLIMNSNWLVHEGMRINSKHSKVYYIRDVFFSEGGGRGDEQFSAANNSFLKLIHLYNHFFSQSTFLKTFIFIFFVTVLSTLALKIFKLELFFRKNQ